MWIMLSCQDHSMVTGLSEDGHIHSLLAENSVLSAKEVSGNIYTHAHDLMSSARRTHLHKVGRAVYKGAG